ncbi:MAG TPA: VTT domain-containing protein [Gemmatimonadaceae bacterium]|nr:VTT domain-containing protein [Gemmatimonadaceae bacterium]
MSFLERMWAYITLGAMGIVWEEASPLIGGLAAHDRHLRLLPVILAVALGTFLATLLLYFFGRVRGRWFRKRWPRFRRVIIQSVALVRRHPWRASLLVRFAWGLRLPLPIACGVARVPLYIYAVGSAVSSVVWSLAFSVLGWGLGRTTQTLIGHVRRWEPYIGALVILSMVVGFVIVRRRRVAERSAHVIDPNPES